MSSLRAQRLAGVLEGRSPGGLPQVRPNGATPPLAPSRLDEPEFHQPVAEVLQQVTAESKALLGQEFQLARTELTSKAKAAGKGAGMLGASAAAAIFAAMALTAAIILGLALVMPAWAAALVVALAYGLLAALLALTGRSRVRAATPLVPEQTVRSLGDIVRNLQYAWKRGESRP